MSATPDDINWTTLQLRRTPGTDTGLLRHGEMQTPVRAIRKAEDGALLFDAFLDAPWLDLLARLFSRVVG